MWTPSKLPIVTTDPGPPASLAGNSWSSSIAQSAAEHLGGLQQPAVQLTDSDHFAGRIVDATFARDLREDRAGQPHGLTATDLLHLCRTQMHRREMGDCHLGR